MVKKEKNFVIAIDTREQLPYFQRGGVPYGLDFRPVQTERRTLATGDYSLVGYEDKIAIERKSLNDFWQSITRERDRFEREFQRLANIPYAFIIVESDFDTATSPELQGRRITGEAISGTVASWEIKYRIPFKFLRNRDKAETFTYQLLAQFARQFIAE